MSSVSMRTLSWVPRTSPSAARSLRLSALPVGLLGVFNNSHLVRGVMAASGYRRKTMAHKKSRTQLSGSAVAAGALRTNA